ncbi:MAG: HAMP domain-containing sensor histidine kinase [bacterium]|nr:HAMP domain-containing sensor histidine kinase [bacterium]
MKRSLHIWIIFALCLIVAFGAMGWVGLTMLRLDRESQQHATLEENVRLALWRMESALAPLIAQESSRPYFVYDSFYVEERAYTRMFSPIERGEVQLPSPLLTEESPYIHLHFQFRPDGELASPQAPIGNMRDVAEKEYTTHERIETSIAHLARLRTILSRDALVRHLPEDSPQLDALARSRSAPQDNTGLSNYEQQAVFNVNEWQARSTSNKILQSNVDANFFSRYAGVREGTMKAVWIGDALILARQVWVNGRSYVQGCWLNWAAVREWLVSGVSDLLPSADLEPAPPDQDAQPARRLASLPITLVPGALPASVTRQVSQVRIWLLIAGGCVLVAAIAVGLLLRGALSLSARRGAFVSAVTHELRTPLTTLRMYAEMLAEGMVSGKEKTRDYLKTLLGESDRLGRLVDNVLAFARLDGRREKARIERISLRELMENVSERLRQRADQAGMSLIVETNDEALSATVRADPAAVEQILFNLVDNACKYGASGSERVIHLQAARDDKSISLRVRDRGPGVPAPLARRLFHPFSKSAQDAANSKPGVGLGLALSRRLARQMGGDLRLDESITDGAAFVLTLPLDKPPA